MANHGYVKTRKDIIPKAFEKAIREINERRFGGLLKVESLLDEKHGWYLSADVRVKQGKDGVWYPVGRRIWLRSKRCIEQRHGCGNDLDSWIDTVFMHELADRFHGRLYDDGGSGSWKGDPTKYPTLADYMMMYIDDDEDRKKAGIPLRTKANRRACIKYKQDDMDGLFKKHLPKEWFPLLGELPKK